jgi:N-formylglutamate amidohydrolase
VKSTSIYIPPEDKDARIAAAYQVFEAALRKILKKRKVTKC